jgi:mono/diheme cytochrome c family protein
MKTVVKTIVVLGILAILAVAAVVYFGLYNVAATNQDGPLLYRFLHYTMRRSVAARSNAVAVPDLSDARYVRNGFDLYRQHCSQCHGAPGVAPDPFAFGLRPEPPNLAEAARWWRSADIYWVIKHGLTKTAMPGWEYRLNEQQLWELTAFVKQLPIISPVKYSEWSKLPAQPVSIAAAADEKPNAAEDVAAAVEKPRPGDPKIGHHAIEQYLCITCHTIPGVTGANTTVGPSLKGIATRQYIAGVLPNTPENMIRWLRDPPKIAPQTAMPNLHIKEQDMRDIVAYLYTLEDVKGR